MTPMLLATKIRLPSLNPKWVERPQLTRLLNDGLAGGRRLTLVSAPAGFGKTTCVAAWLRGLRLPVAWLSLDPADDDPGRFLAYLAAALQTVDPRLGRDVESILRSGQMPEVDVAAASLINDLLDAPQRFVLVLDDFQVIQDPYILRLVEQLVINPPEPLHLVLTTREDPPLPLARLRGYDQMTEIRAGELRFSDEEAGALLNGTLGLALTAQDAALLDRRTEGWVVGLQLAGLSMRGRSDAGHFIETLSGSHRYILTYLTEEVLARQSEETQEFLLQTSVLDHLTGDLCNAVTGRSDSEALLERLHASNLFLTPLDDEQRWYRYHALFADLLRSRQSRLQPSSLALLHQRASAWYETAGMINEAVDHALAAQDFASAVRLLEASGRRMIMDGYIKTLQGWVQAIPEAWRARSPRVNLAFAWMYLLRGRYQEVSAALDTVEAALDPAGAESAAGSAAPDQRREQDLRGEWLALKANLNNAIGRPQNGIEFARQALQTNPDVYISGLAYLALGGAYRLLGDYPHLVEAHQAAIRDCRASGNVLSEMLAVSALVLMSIQYGRLHFAYEVGSKAVERFELSDETPPPVVGTVIGSLGVIDYQWNRLAQARERFARAAAMNQLTGHNAGLVYTGVLMGRLQAASGDLAGAAVLVQQAVDRLAQGVPPWLYPEVIDQQVRIQVAQGRLEAAERVLQQAGIVHLAQPPERFTYPGEQLYLAALRLAAARLAAAAPFEAAQGIFGGRRQAALEVASRIIADAGAAQRQGVVLQARILRALLESGAADAGAADAGAADAGAADAGAADAGAEAAGAEAAGAEAAGAEAAGALDRALADLDEALTLAAPEGFLRVFVDEGPRMAALLRHALQRGMHVEFIQRLLALFPAENLAVENAPVESGVPASVAPTEDSSAPAAPDLVEPLTERETAVLRCMAQGLKYEEIAQTLVISVNTVRFYVKAIYGKLGVNNRTQALAAAQRCHILEES